MTRSARCRPGWSTRWLPPRRSNRRRSTMPARFRPSRRKRCARRGGSCAATAAKWSPASTRRPAPSPSSSARQRRATPSKPSSTARTEKRAHLLPTLLVSDPIFLEHLVPPGHPERPDRLRAIEQALAEDTFDGLVRRAAPGPASEEIIAAAHDPDYVALIRDSVPASGFARLDADTTLSPKSYVAAASAVGAAVMATDAVMAGTVANAFCAVRPPGHHAEPGQAMGFCLFANAVIAARHAQRRHGAGRVAIVDFDVHHGNGTQACVWSDPTILYASTHQMPLYPGTGAASERGVGNVFNAPLAPGAGG